MLLSFSIPQMLPWIINGIPRVGCDPEIWQWYEHIWLPHHPRVEYSERIKGQTIRAFNGQTSPYATLKRGHDLHLWWKSRTRQRKKLGVVPCEHVFFINIKHESTWTNKLTVEVEGQSVFGDDLDQLWHNDGFNSEFDFRQYFVPKPGDRFSGVLIMWNTEHSK